MVDYMTYSPQPQPIQSTLNSSTTPLGASATFTGTWETNYLPDVGVSCLTDQTGTLYFDFSNDGGTTITSTFPVAGFDIGTFHEFHTAVKLGRSFRVRLVNDAVAQTSLILMTWFGTFAKTPNAPINQGVSADNDASLVKAVLIGEDTDTDGTFNNVRTTEFGALKTSIDSSIINFRYDALAKVSVDGTTDRFDYYTGGLLGTKVAEIETVYTDTSKTDVVSSERTNL